ncbi:MAG: DUF5606 domain-containing protein [Bacteroidales bacterium]|nr:DUF5606 domain-containing protein [Bacteroidales bacterium]
MNLKGILSIATYPGLYKHVAQAKNGLIVESIVDGKRCLAFATSRISALEDISIYTTDGDTKLSEVYRNLYKALNGTKTPFNPKKASNEELTQLFSKALPNWDTDRVFLSDIKRAYAWYNILVEKGFVDGEADESEKAEEETKAEEEKPAEAAEAQAEEKPKKTRKKATKKTDEETPAAEEGGEIKTKKRTSTRSKKLSKPEDQSAEETK